jgi:uncharacterized protein (DUF2147 family)
MARTAYCAMVAAAAALMLAAVIPAFASDPHGTWLIADGAAKVRIIACGEALCGTVVWLSHPMDAATGQPQTDKLNSDPAKRRRPMLGVEVILGLQRRGEGVTWSGQIYNPDSGNTYNGSIALTDPAQLRVRGCVLIFCKTEIWTRSD